MAYQIKLHYLGGDILICSQLFDGPRSNIVGGGVGRMNEDMHSCYNFLSIFTDFQCSICVEFQSENLIFP